MKIPSALLAWALSGQPAESADAQDAWTRLAEHLIGLASIPGVRPGEDPAARLGAFLVTREPLPPLSWEQIQENRAAWTVVHQGYAEWSFSVPEKMRLRARLGGVLARFWPGEEELPTPRSPGQALALARALVSRGWSDARSGSGWMTNTSWGPAGQLWNLWPCSLGSTGFIAAAAAAHSRWHSSDADFGTDEQAREQLDALARSLMHDMQYSAAGLGPGAAGWMREHALALVRENRRGPGGPEGET